MDRKLTPQQELASAKSRVRAQAAQLDLRIEAGKRIGALIVRAPVKPTTILGIASTGIAAYLALKRGWRRRT